MIIPRGQTTYTYDETTGSISSIKAPDGDVLAFTYDGFLSLDSTWSGNINGKVSRVYDNNFRITSRSVNDAHTINFIYDNDGLITSAGNLSIAHEALNGLITNTGIDNITATRDYNIFGEPSGYTAAFEGIDFYSASYTRDKLGRITQKVETVEGVTHIYDYVYGLTDRLKEVKKDGAVVSLYQYDANGNRLSATRPGLEINGTYDNQDRLISYGDYTYTFTDNGELTSRIDTTTNSTTTYQYDVLGNLMAVTLPDAAVIEYVIDGVGCRTGKKVDGALVQGFLYKDRLNPIAELDNAGNVVSRFVYGSRYNVPDYMIKGGNTYRIISDHLGSPRIITDTKTGQIVQLIEYNEFGIILSDTNPGFQPFGFAGGIYDQDTELVRFGARDYDPEIGRWTAKDPILFAGGDTNLYGYVQNNPVNFVDPNGLLVLYFGGGVAAGVGYKVNPGDQDSITFFSGTVTEFYGSNRSGGISNGNFFTVGTGRIVGAAAGGGALAGINFGDVEDLSECGSSAGLLVGPFSFELTLDGGGHSITGFSFGFLNKGIGLGLFGQETRTWTISN
ncbi:Rhs family protein [Candidatus Scalindua japonica]|uniref:Rhs family protein n=1 Tax=Candidatus Scalindua japonica TaxID=1284222 RepID=A0A286U016_9BACT|nr:RHS repeat-associated core domain-containing protein [Candidatus Scalindua japonica]GAX61499.1 Rhs family protein [Candidatus Scalindua japonica]